MKRFRLSGAALAVVALVAAMVASAAYGITTATGVKGQPDFKSCVSETGADTCDPTNPVLGLGSPSGIALSDDESRVFAASPSDNAVVVFVRTRGTGKLEQLQLSPNNKGGCTSESGTGAVGDCLPGHGLDGAKRRRIGRRQRLRRFHR